MQFVKDDGGRAAATRQHRINLDPKDTVQIHFSRDGVTTEIELLVAGAAEEGENPGCVYVSAPLQMSEGQMAGNSMCVFTKAEP